MENLDDYMFVYWGIYLVCVWLYKHEEKNEDK